MGRNKLKISPIKKERRRQVTFYKRKKGLIKKAMELSLLCKVNVGLAIIDKRGGLSIFHSDNEIKAALQKYLSGLSRAKEDLKLEQYNQLYSNGKKNFSAFLDDNQTELSDDSSQQNTNEMLDQTEKSDLLFDKGNNKQLNDVLTSGENILFDKSKVRRNKTAKKYIEKNHNEKKNYKIGYVSRKKKQSNIQFQTKKLNISNDNIINKDVFHINNNNQNKNTVNDNNIKILNEKKPIFEISTNGHKKNENLLTNSTTVTKLKTPDNLQINNNNSYNNDSPLNINFFSNNIDNFNIYLSRSVTDSKQLCNLYDTSSEMDSDYL